MVDDTRLDVLNGQQGVRLGRIRITDRSGASALVDLSTAVTMGDVLEAINNVDTINVRASTEGGKLIIDDLSGSAGTLTVSEVSGGNTAADLGIAASIAGSRLSGGNLVSVNTETPLSILNHGIGVQRNPTGNDLNITLRDGTAFSVNLTSATTLGGVINAINQASAESDNPGALTASINAQGTGLTLTDSSAGAGSLSVTSATGSRAAHDLGIAASSDTGTINGSALLADLQSVLLSRLNGGNGVSRGTISITDRAGVVSQIDLSAANTIQDVLAAINNPSTQANVTASFNSTANRIVITDNSGQSGALVIEDIGGTTMAADLGIVANVEAASVSSNDLARQFVSLDSRLDTLRGGAGISLGRFSITNSMGAVETINLTSGTYTTLRDVADRINANGIGVTARLNDTGDGLLLEDSAGGPGLLTVTDDAATSARDLRISGTAKVGQTYIDGTNRISIEVDETDTLETLRGKMNDSGAGIIVNMLNDGSAARPHRLSIVSTRSGEAGALFIDGADVGLNMTEVLRGRDAVLSIGDGQSSSPLVVTSRTNTFSGILAGVTLDAKAADAGQMVTVNISRNSSAVLDGVKSMVGGLNSVLTRIATYTKYDSEKKQGAILQGNSSMITSQGRIFNAVLGAFKDTGSQYSSLASIGFKIKEGKIELDEAAFNAALSANPADIEKLFMDTDNGVVKKLSDLMTTLSSTGTGTLSVQANQLESQSKMIQSRINNMDKMLELKRDRLTMQFINMERAIGQIQIQQSALTSLQQLASNFNFKSR